jgi:hypothetical protein
MKRPSGILLILTAVLGFSAGCDLFAPDEIVREVRVGTIHHYQDSIATELPDTVSAGRPFLLRIRTYGGGCILKGDTEVVVNESVPPQVQLTPFDYEAVDFPRHTGCTDELSSFDHVALATLNRVGPATVQIIGWQKPNARVLTVSKQIVVSSESVSRVNAVVLVGKVTDPTGQPVANARVRLVVEGCLPFAQRDTVTDPLGNYRQTLLGQRSCTDAAIDLLVNSNRNTLRDGGGQVGRVRLTPLEDGPAEVRTNVQLRAF